MSEDPYASIRSKLPKKTEVALWNEKKVKAFLLFFEYFVTEGRIKCTVEKRREMEVHAHEQEFWAEFVARIDVPTGTEFSSTPLFTQRLITFSRNVLSHLKTNPHLISSELETIMDRNPRCHWAMTLFKLKKGTIADTIQASDIETTDRHDARLAPESTAKRPEVMFNDSLIRMTSILKDLTKGIKREDLKRMSTEDRIKYATSMMKVVGGLVRKYTPNKQVFQTININSAKREDLEKSVLDYAQINLRENEE